MLFRIPHFIFFFLFGNSVLVVNLDYTRSSERLHLGAAFEILQPLGSQLCFPILCMTGRLPLNSPSGDT